MTAEVTQILGPGADGLAAIHTAFGILRTSIQDGALPAPLPKLPRFLQQEATTLSESLPLVPAASSGGTNPDGVASGTV